MANEMSSLIALAIDCKVFVMFINFYKDIGETLWFFSIIEKCESICI